MFAVITENDESQWNDDTGVLYHFPKRYKPYLLPGTDVVYYRGKLKKQKFAGDRLSPAPHYFGLAKIGEVYPDSMSQKGDLFATIDDYRPFLKAIPIRNSAGEYFEAIPESRKVNYWRDGVRPVNPSTYAVLVGAATLASPVPTAAPKLADSTIDDELESAEEGTKTQRYVTTYERDPKYRKQALAIHGFTCRGCELSMADRYGPYAEGLIHVHHIVPVSTYDAPKKINPAMDLVPLCPNCHSVVHRKKDKTLSIPGLRALLGKR